MSGLALLTLAPRYFCGQDAQGTYTYAETPKGKQAIIRWKSEYFSKSNWTPETRCQEVSPKFNQAAMNNQLNYITNDTQNNLPVVCAAIDESEGRRIPEYASPCTPWAKNIGLTVFGFPGEQTFCDNFCIFIEICLRNPVSGGKMG